jgi:hypothetical protein
MTIEVGTRFGGGVTPPAVGGWNERLFVRLIVKLVAPGPANGTVITTGDQVPDVEAGFSAAQVAVAPVAVPQK